MFVAEFQNVHKSYQDRKVLEGATFSLEKGKFYYLVGRTGAGKSTVLKLAYADIKPDKGTVQVAGFDIGKISSKEIPFLRRKLGIVFQDFQLLGDRTIEQNLRFALQATGWKDKKKIMQRITKVLMQVGLTAKQKAYPHQLSGGEQQRAVIARALLNNPVMLIADEPTGNLDPEASDNIMELLFDINREGTTVFMATHEYELIKNFPAEIFRIKEGEIQKISTEELL